jgi:uncharacterized Zn finger protein
MMDKKTSKHDLMATYNLLKEEAKTNSHIEEGRLNRALGIAMRKESYEKYYTTFTGCTCPDQANRSQFICKHRLSFMLEHGDDISLMLFEGTPIS